MVSSIARSLADKPKDVVFDPPERALEVRPKFYANCTVCKDKSLHDLKEFLSQLQRHVEQVISEVSVSSLTCNCYLR